MSNIIRIHMECDTKILKMIESIYMNYFFSFFFMCSLILISKESLLLCPFGRYWDDIAETCRECESGFQHFNCSKQCRFPEHGFECQSKCNCSEKICSNILGCNMVNVSMVEQESAEIVCDVGFYGQDCSKPCRYPNYGPFCQKKCDCNETNCNNVKGCLLDILSKIVTEVHQRGNEEIENSSIDSPMDSSIDSSVNSSIDSSTDVNIGILTTIIIGSLLIIIVVTQLIRKRCSRRIPTVESNYNPYHI